MAETEGERDGDEVVRVRGARTHNLEDIDVDVPRDRLVVLTGVSGSGKSSLAFDTLHAEGQRRFVEGLSSYARQFLDQLERPDVDAIEGLPPTVSIDQRAGAASPRSTVGTLTEVNDYLRILYARTGLAHCPRCRLPIQRQTPEQMVAAVLAMSVGRRVLVLAPLVRGRKGKHAEAFQAIRRARLLRARVDGEVLELGVDDPRLAATRTHDIEAVVDRLVVRDGIRPRLAESVDLALKLGDGTVLLSAQTDGGWEDLPLSVHFACPACGAGIEELEPRTFGFNSPHGACPACDGLGRVAAFDPDLVIPDRSLSLRRGAVAPWARPSGRPHEPAWVDRFLSARKLRRDRALADWPAAALEVLLRGDPTDRPAVPGVLAELDRAFAAARTDRARSALDAFRSESVCPACAGARLRPEARAVTLGGHALPELAELPVSAARDVLERLAFEPDRELVGPPLVREAARRLAFLEEVGLGYLTLARRADTLSGGELQRVRLATQIGSGLVGVCYVLDEPTAGLHPRDTDRLLDCLRRLRDQGNSVLVVEHDEATIRAADWLIDLGPGAGPDGGRVVAVGRPDRLVVVGDSSTARRLQSGPPPPGPPSGRLARSPGRLTIRAARERNLKGIDVSFPLGTLCCVAGVSGSGKSTLVDEVLSRAVRRGLERRGPKPGEHAGIDGLEAIDKLIEIDQGPIGRGPRSTPATATGLFDEIRKVFARTREARLRGYHASRFSFNVKGGRCETCEGQGVRRVEMHFLPDLFVTCDACRGLRFNRQTLEVRFKGHSIGEVLALRVDACRALFEAQPKVVRGLEALHEAGLGYLTLGQSSTTLSGGEAQRVKLAGELGRASTGRTLYILDEPTAGLHFVDVARLLLVLERLADLGNTVVVIEHNLDVLARADWVVDLGPGGGDDGGQVLAAGPPAELARASQSVTGPFLLPRLAATGTA